MFRNPPTDARMELAWIQGACADAGLSYADYLWSKRYPEPHPKPSAAWPFRRMEAAPAANVTQIKRKKS